jgi:hypothetical protein
MHPFVAAGFITNVSHDRAVKRSTPAPRWFRARLSEPKPRTP